MHGGGENQRTGRENTVVFFCRGCGRESRPQPWPVQEVGVGTSHCADCGESLHFVAYEASSEEGAARAVITKMMPRLPD